MEASTALTKRNADTALMPPPPPSKRIKRPPKVLDEESYTDALSHIIARDFFPGLLETETQQDYLDALNTNDAEWIEEAGRRLVEVMTPVDGSRRGRRGVSMTPDRTAFPYGGSQHAQTPVGWQGATPLHASATPAHRTTTVEQKPGAEEVDLNLSLAAFQAKYTSEDNESFNRVLDKQNAKRAEKYSWMWNGNKLPSARQIAQAVSNQRKLLRAGPSSSPPTTDRALVLARPSEDQDARPAMIDPLRTSGNPRNNFMFDPPSLTDTHSALPTIAQTAQEASSASPKSIQHANTRLPLLATTASAIPVPESPSLSAIDAAIRRPGPAPPSTAASIVADQDGSATPRVNGYPFVDAEPAVHELAPPPPATDLLSRLLSTNDASSGPNPFSILPSSPRETLHHRIVERASRSHRRPRPATTTHASLEHPLLDTPGRTPTPRFASAPRPARTPGGAAATAEERRERVRGALTPAARMLYHSMGVKRDGGAGGAGVMGSKGYFDDGARHGGRDRAASLTPKGLRVRGGG